MGENGQLWGGECLLVDYQHSQYLGGLPAVALPEAILQLNDLGATGWLTCINLLPQWRNSHQNLYRTRLANINQCH